jgi:hypothetical protein
MKLVAIALVLASASAFAAEKSGSTEYYFQPSAGRSAVELKYKMDLLPGKLDMAGTEVDAKQEMSDIYLNYAYGLNEGNAIGAETFFGSNKWTVATTSHTANGMGDLAAFYKGFTGMWHYGATFGFSLEKSKIDATTTLPDNRASGGMSLKANVGLLMNSGSLNYGADLSYLMPFERQVDDTDSTKVTGGNTLKIAPFLEWNWGMGFLGGELSYNMVDDTKNKGNTTETTYKGEGYTGLSLYGSFDFNDMFTGLLTLGMNMHPEHDFQTTGTTKMKAYTETIAGLGVRMNF